MGHYRGAQLSKNKDPDKFYPRCPLGRLQLFEKLGVESTVDDRDVYHCWGENFCLSWLWNFENSSSMMSGDHSHAVLAVGLFYARVMPAGLVLLLQV